MPDNPRMPGHPSDIHSSRSSETNTGAGYSSPPPPAYTPPPPQSSGSNHPRNLIIGAVVTVLSSVAIYYLTIYQNRNKPEANVKESTIQVWDSYIGYENIYTQNMVQLDSVTPDPVALVKEIRKESEKFTRDVELLSKKKNIDDDLVTALKRRLENEKNYLPQIEIYMNKLVAIRQSNDPLIEKIEEQAAEMRQWLNTYRSMYDRAVNDIRGISKVLSSRYRHNFDINEFELIKITPGKIRQLDSMITILQDTKLDSVGNIIMGIDFARNVKPASLVGHWATLELDVVLEMDGKATWTADDGGTTAGTWKIENDRLKVDAVTKPENKKVSWAFRLAYIQANSFTAANDNYPYEIYKMVRKNP